MSQVDSSKPPVKEEAGEGSSVPTETTPAEPMEIENGVEIPFEKARVLKGHDSEVGIFRSLFVLIFLNFPYPQFHQLIYAIF